MILSQKAEPIKWNNADMGLIWVQCPSASDASAGAAAPSQNLLRTHVEQA